MVIMRATIMEYLKSVRPENPSVPLPVSNIDMLSLFTFLFMIRYFSFSSFSILPCCQLMMLVRELVAEVSVLWRGVQRLLQVEALYSKQISSHPFCGALGRWLARL